ncbi:MAG TPA: hypothetical protein VFT22_18485 [Kofleriaceae bacterium]|nr:hypothetical protein [Kofleriaceae bacterium]
MTTIRIILVIAGCLGSFAVASHRAAAGDAYPICKLDGMDVPDPRAIVLSDKLTLKSNTRKIAKDEDLAACTASKDHVVDRKSCPSLFELETLRDKTRILIAGYCVLETGGLAVKPIPGNTESIQVPDDGTLDLRKLASKRILLTSTNPAIAPLVVESVPASYRLPVEFKPGETIAYFLVGTNLHSIELAAAPAANKAAADKAAADKAAAEKAAAEKAAAEPRLTADAQATEICGKSASADDKKRFNVMCFVGDDKRIALVDVPSDGGTIMRPNRSILVLVVHPPERPFTVTVDGDFGVFRPGLADLTPPPPPKVGAQARTEPEPLVDRHLFGSRLPGKASVHVRSSAAGSTVPEAVVELLVEETYAGALRVGVGGVFGGAIDRGFTLRTAPGSGQQEIVAGNGGDVDAELVVGASIFLEEGGRGYAVPGHNKHFAPYFGIGVLNQTDSGLKTFRSFQLGLEYELNPHFSIAVTAVARRITRLSGASVGDPVQMSGSIPTETDFAFGWGIVINLSPDFLRLAARSGSSFF